MSDLAETVTLSRRSLLKAGALAGGGLMLSATLPGMARAATGKAEHAVLNVQRGAVDVVHRGQRWAWERPDPFGDHAVAAGDGTLLAPMPGTVLAVNVTEGQDVAEGETLGVMEAMKMELALKAPFAGTVTTVGATTGDLVKLGAVLFTVEEST